MKRARLCSTNNHTAGFTLIELLVTILVAGILAALAIPAFTNFVFDDRDVSQINSLVSSLNYARSEAVKRNTAVGVTVCASNDGATCSGLANGWSSGWIVLDMDPSDPSPVLQSVPALSGSNVLTATGGGATGINFNSIGAVAAPAKIKICDPRGGAHARDVEVNPVGNIASSQQAGQDANGVALACP